MSTTQEKVAKGTAWLDEQYPQWWEVIDLSTLDISNCDLCVLGQVYDIVPFAEKDELIAQVVAGYPGSFAEYARLSCRNGTVGGFTVIAEGRGMIISGEVYDMGFAVDWMQGQEIVNAQYAELLEEWTKVIIQKRLDAHHDVVAPSNLDNITPEIFDIYATAV